jgi:hypothetical protein
MAMLYDKVPAGARPAFALPGAADPLTVVDVRADGLVVEPREGQRRALAWHELPAEALYDLARQLVKADDPATDARELADLGHMAGLAGREEDARQLADSAVARDGALAEFASGAPALSLSERVMREGCWEWDDPGDPKTASAIVEDREAVFHVYRYMRTLGPDGLRAAARARADYAALLNTPEGNRGKVFTVTGSFWRHYQTIRWTRYEGHREAGIQDLDFFFMLDMDQPNFYLVSVPHEARDYRQGERIRLTGVYMRRWPNLAQGKWHWRVWLAGLEVQRVPVRPDRSFQYFLVAFLVAGLGGIALVFFAARREAKDSAEARERLRARRRGPRLSRDEIRRKVEEHDRREEEGGTPRARDS